jgi:hypothetical protein
MEREGKIKIIECREVDRKLDLETRPTPRLNFVQDTFSQ